MEWSSLVGQVHRDASGDDALARLDAAIALSVRLADTGDRLLDHFVAEARAAGCSWTVVGEHLGVSKQAARKRFTDGTGVVVRAVPLASPRLRVCLARAEADAVAAGSGEVETHHLLSGLLAEGVAAAILERYGVTSEVVRASAERLFGTPARRDGDVLELSEESICVLDAATEHAARQYAGCADPFVGTEHVLFFLATDPGGRARRVLNDLNIDGAAIKREVESWVALPLRSRIGRRRRVSAELRCSFCRRPRGAVGRLVAGPGVWICAACTQLAAEEHRVQQRGSATV